MNVIKLKAGELVAKRQEKVMEWYLIQEGAVVQKFGFSEITLGRNSMIGILETDWFICDYVVKEDVTMIVIPCKNGTDLQKMLMEHENFRAIFLKAAIEQRHKALCLYSELRKKCEFLHKSAEKLYDDYKALCAEYLLEEQPFLRMEGFAALEMTHRAESWEINNSNSLMKNYLKDYMQLMIKDDGLCVGAIMEASAQMRRVTQGIGEMVTYLMYNKEILFAESENDLFHLFFDLAVNASSQKQDITKIKAILKYIWDCMQMLNVYPEKQMSEAKRRYGNYDFSGTTATRINVAKEDGVAHIMKFAGYENLEIQNYKKLLEQYWELPDRMSTESDTFRLRKQITQEFYQIYLRAFLKSMESKEKLSPIMVMFFNFGFMNVNMLGEEYTNAVYNLTEHLGLFSSEHVYTIYQWMLSIYKGEREPSKNEFDQDYRGYLMDLRRRGELTEQQMKEEEQSAEKRVEFEIMNLFTTGSRMTYGKITTFCPVLNEDDFINSVEKLALTSEKLEVAINKIRDIDYSIFYREVLFRDAAHGVNQEPIMKEVLPDVILMPVVGSRGAMWQETANAKTDTSARLLFPIFMTGDLDEQMAENMGRYRWEICRKIQGVYWNDIREKSLTAEYCDYLQFYRKNNNLSVEAKEKVKLALSRSRNNYREVFAKEYQNWLKFESKGSFRLNKVARDILIQYCPFAKEIRQSLKTNPVFESAFNKLEINNQKKVQRITAFQDKYVAAGGTVNAELKDNLLFYQM